MSGKKDYLFIYFFFLFFIFYNLFVIIIDLKNNLGILRT